MTTNKNLTNAAEYVKRASAPFSKKQGSNDMIEKRQSEMGKRATTAVQNIN